MRTNTNPNDLSLQGLIEVLGDEEVKTWSGFLRFTVDDGGTTSLARCTIRRAGACIFHLEGLPPKAGAIVGEVGGGRCWRIELSPLNTAAERELAVARAIDEESGEDARPRYLLCNIHQEAQASKVLGAFWRIEWARESVATRDGGASARVRDPQGC